MVYLFTPNGEYKPLPCPGEVTIGRGDQNSIVIRDRSVSTHHCRLTIETLPPQDKVQIWIEDLGSKNGTYTGENRLEIEKLIGKKILHFGDCLRLGYMNDFFQLVDHVPIQQEIAMPELTIVPKTTSIGMEQGNNGGGGGVGGVGGGGGVGSNTRYAGVGGGGEYDPRNSSGVGIGDIGSGLMMGRGGGLERNEGLILPELNLPKAAADPPVNRVVTSQAIDSDLPAYAEIADSVDGTRAPISGEAQSEASKPGGPSEFQQNVQPNKGNNNAAAAAAAAVSLPSSPINHVLQSFQLPYFQPFDRDGRGSVLKYLDKLDQAREQLISLRILVLKDRHDLDDYISVVLGKLPKSKERKNRYQSRYLQLCAPKQGTAEEKEGKRNTPREVLMAELLAESMAQASGGESCFTSTEGVLSRLHDLLQHCLLGSQINSSRNRGVTSTALSMEELANSRELDYLVKNELLSALQVAIEQGQIVQQSAVLSAMHRYIKNKENPCNLVEIIGNSVEVLLRIASFVTRQEEIVNKHFATFNFYEVLLVSLSYVVEDFYDLYTIFLTLSAEVEQAVLTHTHANRNNNKGRLPNLLSSYEEEIDEMRGLKHDADLLALLERVREQEAGLVSERFKRLSKLVDIGNRHQLRGGFRKWLAATKDLKRQDIRRFDFVEKKTLKLRRKFWQVWYKAFQNRKHLGKCVFRMMRAMGYNHEKVKRIYWDLWKRNSHLSPRWARASDSLAQLKLSVLQLQAQLQELGDKDANIAALAAEKALNRELNATNNELRASIQNLQLQLLELCNVSLAKRRDVVLHDLLDKEEAVARSRKEVKLLKAELDQLRRLLEDSHQRNVKPHEDNGHNEEEEEEEEDRVTNRSKPIKTSRKVGFVTDQQWQQRQQGINGGVNQQLIMPNPPARASKPSALPPVQRPLPRSGLMSRREAAQIVLLEVRRLRDSLSRLQKQRDELKAMNAEEVQKRIDQTMASQQVTYRLLDMERSAGALRELLKQRIGLNAYTDLVLSLESMGVGSHVLQQSALHAVPDNTAVKKLGKPVKKPKESSIDYQNAVEEAFG
eukprot:scaffold183_cov174-Ochromonas_danica.AAC.1